MEKCFPGFSKHNNNNNYRLFKEIQTKTWITNKYKKILEFYKQKQRNYKDLDHMANGDYNIDTGI